MRALRKELEEKDVEMAAEGEEAPKKKKVVKKNPVPFVWHSTGLEPTLLEQYRQQEAEMHAADKLVADTEVRFAFLRLV